MRRLLRKTEIQIKARKTAAPGNCPPASSMLMAPPRYEHKRRKPSLVVLGIQKSMTEISSMIPIRDKKWIRLDLLKPSTTACACVSFMIALITSISDGMAFKTMAVILVAFDIMVFLIWRDKIMSTWYWFDTGFPKETSILLETDVKKKALKVVTLLYGCS
jgi:hypothetical protein